MISRPVVGASSYRSAVSRAVRNASSFPSQISYPANRFSFYRRWQPTTEAPFFVKPEEVPDWLREHCLSDGLRYKVTALVEKTNITRAAFSGLMRMIESHDFFLLNAFSPDSVAKTKNLNPLHFFCEGLVVENIGGQTFISAQVERAQFLAHVAFDGSPQALLPGTGIFSALPDHIERLFYFDTETNGTNAKAGDEPIEVAWHVVNRDGVVEETATYLLKKPGIVVPRGALNVHELTPELLLEQGEDPKVVYAHFLDVLNDQPQKTLPIGHKSPFDITMINYDLLRYGLRQIPHMQGLDTLTMVKILFPQLLPKSRLTPDSYKLKLAASFFDPDQTHLQFHHAADDNLAVAFLLENMVAHATSQGSSAKALVNLSLYETQDYLATVDPSTRQRWLPTSYHTEKGPEIVENEFHRDLVEKVCKTLESENPRAFLACANPVDRNVGMAAMRAALEKGQRVLWIEPARSSLENSCEAAKINAPDARIEVLDAKRFAGHQAEVKQAERLQIWKSAQVVLTSAGLLAYTLREIQRDYSRVPFGDSPEQTFPLQEFDLVILGHFRDYVYRPLVPILNAFPRLKVLGLCAAPGSDPFSLRDALAEFGMDRGVIEPCYHLEGAPKPPTTIFRIEPVPGTPTLALEETFVGFISVLLEPYLRSNIWSDFIREKSTDGNKKSKHLGLDRAGVRDGYLAFFSNLKQLMNSNDPIDAAIVRSIFEPILSSRLKAAQVNSVVADLQSEILYGEADEDLKYERLLRAVSRKVVGFIQLGFIEFLQNQIDARAFASKVNVRGYHHAVSATFPLVCIMRLLFGEQLIKAGYLEEAKNYLAPLYDYEFRPQGTHRPRRRQFTARFLESHEMGHAIFTQLLNLVDSTKNYRREYLLKQIEKIVAGEKPSKIVVYLESFESVKIVRQMLEEKFQGKVAVFDSKHSIPNQRGVFMKAHPESIPVEILLSTSSVFSRKIFPAEYGFVLKPLTEPQKLQQILDKISLRLEMLFDVTQSGSLKRAQSLLHRQEEIVADPHAFVGSGPDPDAN